MTREEKSDAIAAFCCFFLMWAICITIAGMALWAHDLGHFFIMLIAGWFSGWMCQKFGDRLNAG